MHQGPPIIISTRPLKEIQSQMKQWSIKYPIAHFFQTAHIIKAFIGLKSTLSMTWMPKTYWEHVFTYWIS